MLRVTLIIAYFFACTSCTPIGEKVEMKIDLVPDEALEKLDAKERATVEELMKHYEKRYKNEEEFLAVLKKKSPDLYEKTKNFYDFIKSKVNSLSDETKTYMKKVIRDTRKLHAQLFAGDKKLSLEDVRKAIRSHYTYYKNLSNIAKKEVKVVFPLLAMIFEDEKTRAKAMN